jgi:hypothetical protein
VSDIESLHANITDALAELRGAREIHAHSPDAESAGVVEMCEWRLDTLLGRQSAHDKAEAMVTP